MLKIVECMGRDVPLGAYLEHDILSKDNILLLRKGTIVDDNIKGLLCRYNSIVKVNIDIKDKIIEEVNSIVTSLKSDNSLVLDDTIKERALKGVEYMYSNTSSSDMAVVAKDTSSILLDTVKNSSATNIVLRDLKVSDDYTFKHCVDVATMAILVGQSLNLDRVSIENAATAGILHDVGKVSIPDEILNKPGKLTDEEFKIIQQHPVYGYELLKNNKDINDEVRNGVLMHHEKADGTGYPLRFNSERISILGKLLAVVDVYDALVTKRPYRSNRIEPATAIEMMLSMGNQFDLNFLQNFLKCIILYPIGTTLLLSDNKVYKVIEQNIGYPLRPVISDIITNEKLNLMDISHLNLTILSEI